MAHAKEQFNKKSIDQFEQILDRLRSLESHYAKVVDLTDHVRIKCPYLDIVADQLLTEGLKREETHKQVTVKILEAKQLLKAVSETCNIPNTLLQIQQGIAQLEIHFTPDVFNTVSRDLQASLADVEYGCKLVEGMQALESKLENVKMMQLQAVATTELEQTREQLKLTKNISRKIKDSLGQLDRPSSGLVLQNVVQLVTRHINELFNLYTVRINTLLSEQDEKDTKQEKCKQLVLATLQQTEDALRTVRTSMEEEIV